MFNSLKTNLQLDIPVTIRNIKEKSELDKIIYSHERKIYFIPNDDGINFEIFPAFCPICGLNACYLNLIEREKKTDCQCGKLIINGEFC